jgi:hypothetical protein
MVEYSYAVSDYLKQRVLSNSQKFNTIRSELKRHSIPIFFGGDADYFVRLNEWLFGNTCIANKKKVRCFSAVPKRDAYWDSDYHYRHRLMQLLKRKVHI